MAPFPTLLALMAGLFTAGCGGIALPDWKLAGASRTPMPGNYTDAGPIPERVKRVAVLPLHSETWNAPDMAAIEASFAAELGKRERFELTALSRTALGARFGRESFGSAELLPSSLLPWLQQQYGADAVLFLDLTHFAPYQPIALGVRAKLMATGDGHALWSCDSVFDSAQPEIADAARHYQDAKNRSSAPVDHAAGSLQSPARFARYVAHTMFGTLPPRETR